MRELDEFMLTVTAQIAGKEHEIIEKRIRMLVQDRPRWWPEWFYRYTISRLLVMEERQR